MYTKKEMVEELKKFKPNYDSSDYFFVNYSFKTEKITISEDQDDFENYFTIIINPKELNLEKAAEFILRKINNELRSLKKTEEHKSKNIISMIFNMFSNK